MIIDFLNHGFDKTHLDRVAEWLDRSTWSRAMSFLSMQSDLTFQLVVDSHLNPWPHNRKIMLQGIALVIAPSECERDWATMAAVARKHRQAPGPAWEHCAHDHGFSIDWERVIGAIKNGSGSFVCEPALVSVRYMERQLLQKLELLLQLTPF